ncbi:family 16 glycoside hydrolase [Agriterribacter sp.]|uniref:family 16 glycoside hydrolase n=1 Tax=Agriterribacter sp. TaxID=2821509 RepID=UPI002CD47C60|nr:family 16 glycoside hydrolase [Agriterribacter sp.]HTN05086.1 family 16 glycoside hydrolase [Agriterribacter sp.]
MRQILITFLFFFSVLQMAAAQTDDNRTVTTKIADLLAKTPADDAAQLNANAEAVAKLGENGLAELAARLNTPGDHTKLHYAINGFSFSASQPGKESWRQMAVKAYGQALEKLSDKEAQLFIITQLEHVGKDDAVAYLKNYLHDERLSDAASRALATIHTEAANNALLQALPGAAGNAQLSLVQALGHTRFAAAVPQVTALAKSNDPSVTKVALYALARTGDPSSLKLLNAAAAKSGYSYDVTDATSSYLLYLNCLAATGHTNEAQKAANTLLKKASGQVYTRTAALQLLTDIQGPNSMDLLTKAMKDKDAEYREAALKFARPYLTEANSAQWIATFNKAGNGAKAGILNLFGDKAISAALPLALQSLQSGDAGVRLAAIAAAAKIGQQEALPPLLNVLKNGNAEEIAAVKTALLSTKGDKLVPGVSEALETASPAGKAALIEILGERGARGKAKEVLAFVNNPDPAVSQSARTALKNMVSPVQLPQLTALLLSAKNNNDISDMQELLVAALSMMKNPEQASAVIIAREKSAPADKKSLFYNVLAGIGSKKGLNTVLDAFSGGNAQTKGAVIAALSNWKGGLATTQLYQVLEQEGKGTAAPEAVEGFIRQISISDNTGDQKLILLRNAMDFAGTADQKKKILGQVGKCNTLPALLYAGTFLDDPALQRQAGNAVVDIALANKTVYGDNVRALLEKTIQVMGSGNESQYLKEAIQKHLAAMPQGKGFVPIFNGQDLTGWKGLVADPVKRAKMDAATLEKEQAKADEIMRTGWVVKDGLLVFTGKGENLCTDKKYGDFEMYVDWKITKDGDAGIYLRGTPQVQIWDTSRVDVGAQVGSGGLYNNQKNESKPSKLADNAIGDWNTFHITMVGDQVTVYLNGQLVVDKVPLENYWDRNLPIFPEEQIELQAHGTYVAYRDIYLREIPRPQPYVLTGDEQKEGYKILFDGTALHEWVGNKTSYIIEDGNIAVYPKRGGNGNLYTKDEYSDFIYRFEFKLTPGANNGVGIRTPLTGDGAYEGMEIQVLDNEADIYKDLKPYQYHGSVYGVIAAKRGYLKPVGEWNEEEIYIKGNKIRVTLNGTVILDGDIAEASKNGTADHRDHPGLKRTTGHIGFLGHGDTLFFRNIRIKDLSKAVTSPSKAKTKK